MEAEFATLLEIKSNGSRLVSGWTTFLFVLKGQEFVPYLANDRSTPRGCLKIANCQAAKLPLEANDGKKYTFKLASPTTAYVFNAPNEITRERVITLLNFAGACPAWFNPYSLTATLDLSTDAEEVSRVFFNSLHSKVAARRIQSFFFGIRSKKRVSRLVCQYPEIYLVSVNKAEMLANPTDVFAYISGLVVKPDTKNVDIFNEPHKTTVPVCMASTPTITSTTAFHVAIAAHSGALSYLSVGLFSVESKEQEELESLGIAFVPLSDVPRRRRQRDYTPYTATLPLEPYLLPDLTVVANPSPLTTGPTAPPAGPLTAHGHHRENGTANGGDDTRSEVSAAAFRDLESVSNAGTEVDHVLPMPPGPVPMSVGASKLLRGPSLDHPVSGTVSVTVYTPAPAYSMCGWLLKKSDTWMIGGSYRPYWFVLMNGELQYFQQQPGATVLSLDQPKKLILCQNITAVTHKNGVISVHFKQRGVKGVWQMKSDPAHAPPITGTTAALSPTPSPTTGRAAGLQKAHSHSALHPLPAVTTAMVERMWVRKLTRCASNVSDPDLLAAAGRGLFQPSKVGTRTVSAKTHTPDGMPHELVRAFSKERRPSSIKVG